MMDAAEQLELIRRDCQVANWDSYGAKPITTEALSATEALLYSLCVSPSNDGGITVTLADESVMLGIGADGKLSSIYCDMDDFNKSLRAIRLFTLVKRFKERTMLRSSGPTDDDEEIVEILAMGPSIIPLVLRDLEQREDNGWAWFFVLYRLTGQDGAAGTTTFGGARQEWLRWGRENGFLRA